MIQPTPNQQAVFDLLALAHSIEPMTWKHWPHSDFYSWASSEVGECPLAHAARVLIGVPIDCADWPEAADRLGIPIEDAHSVASAADGRTHPLRPALLAVYGLSEVAS